MHIRQMMMMHLLDNAIKYAGDEKKVTVSLLKKQERFELRVHNTGAPIPAAALPHFLTASIAQMPAVPAAALGLAWRLPDRLPKCTEEKSA